MVRAYTSTMVTVVILLSAALYAHASSEIVTILPFSNYTGDDSLEWLSNGIPEILALRFNKVDSITVIDSAQLEAILEQHSLHASDLADPKNVLRFRKLIVARMIVHGSYQKASDDILTIIGKLTDVETGKILEVVEKSGNQKNTRDLMEEISDLLILAIDPTAFDRNADLQNNLKPRSRLGAALKSTVMPGWGDLPDRKVPGVLMGALGLGTLAGTVVCGLNYKKNDDEYMDAYDRCNGIQSSPDCELNAMRDDVESSKNLFYIFLSSAVLVRVVGALESAIFVSRSSEGESGITSSIEDGRVTLAWRHRF